MAPKNNRSVEELVGALSAQLEDISNQLKSTNSRFDKLESLFEKLQSENKDLKEQLLNKDSEIISLKNRMNSIEQHSRSSCIRIFNLNVDDDDSDPLNVMEQLYVKALLPILQGALTKGRIKNIPACDNLIQTAHVLPGKPGKAKPILCRLYSNHFRTIIMQLKKEFAPRAPARVDGPSAANTTNRLPPFTFPIYEDVTRDTFLLMRRLNSHDKVKGCWSAGGQLRFVTTDSDQIKKVVSVYDTIEKILG